NWHLYSNPSPPNTSYASDVFEGTLNAPGTYWTGPRVECGALPSYLLPGAATLPCGPYTPCTGTSPTTYAVGLQGFEAAAPGCPAILPLIAQWLGVRYNVSLRQTCMIERRRRRSVAPHVEINSRTRRGAR